jgi:ParB-like chromosome segregation protein Spo0J
MSKPDAAVVAISNIIVGNRHRKDMGDIDALAESIKSVGLLHPIVVTRAGSLIAGQRRLAACKLLGWTEVPVRIVDLDVIACGEFAENVVREDFTPSEMAAILKTLEPSANSEARDRQLSGLKRGKEAREGNLPTREKGRAREQIAKGLGTSRRTLDKIDAITKAAEQSPETHGHLIKQMDETSVDAAYRQIKKQQEPRKEKQDHRSETKHNSLMKSETERLSELRSENEALKRRNQFLTERLMVVENELATARSDLAGARAVLERIKVNHPDLPAAHIIAQNGKAH